MFKNDVTVAIVKAILEIYEDSKDKVLQEVSNKNLKKMNEYGIISDEELFNTVQSKFLEKWNKI